MTVDASLAALDWMDRHGWDGQHDGLDAGTRAELTRLATFPRYPGA
jgi:hypothetical protein